MVHSCIINLFFNYIIWLPIKNYNLEALPFVIPICFCNQSSLTFVMFLPNL